MRKTRNASGPIGGDLPVARTPALIPIKTNLPSPESGDSDDNRRSP